MAELDSLEIRIEADSAQAAESLEALARSLDGVGSAASVASAPLRAVADSVSAIKDAFKGINTATANANNLTGALSGLSAIEMPSSISSINDALKPLREISETFREISSNKSIEKAIGNIGLISAAFESVEVSDPHKIDNLVSSINRLNEIQIDEDVASSVRQLGTGLKAIANVQSNDNASKSIRNLISTVRTVTDEDFQRLHELSEQASKIAVYQMPEETTIPNPIPDDVIDGMRQYFTAVQEVVSENDEAGRSAKSLAQRFEELKNAVLNTAASVTKFSLKTVFAPLTAIGSAIKSVTDKLGNFLSGIKRIAMYRAIRSALKAISQGLQEGRENLYQYSILAGTEFSKSMDKAATAFLYLKNSIGAATAPLTNYFVPILDRMIDKFVEVINKFNEMTAALTGASTWTRAIKYPIQWQDAADDAEKSAKKLKSTILGFDELNVIEPNSAASKNKGLTAEDYAKMFEEVKTQVETQNKLRELVMPIKLAWDNEGDKTLDTIKQTWKEILGLIGDVGESFRTVWQNGTGQRTIELFLQITQEIVGTVGAIARNFRKAWNEGGKGTQIIQNIWNVANNLLTVFRDIWTSIREWAEGLDWNPLMSAFVGLTEAADKLSNPDSGAAKFLKDLFTDILLPIGRWIVETGVPKVIEFAAALVRLATDITNNIYPVWEWISKNILSPGLTFAGSTIEVVITALTDLLNVIDKLANADFDFSDSILVGFGRSIGESENPFVTMLEYWEDGVQQIFPELFSGEASNFQKSLEGIGEKVFDIGDSIKNSDIDYSPSGLGKDLGDNTKDFISTFSPIQIGRRIGENLGSGMKEGLSDKWDDLQEWFVDWSDNVAKTFDDLDKSIKKKWDDTKKSLSDGWENIKKKVTDFSDHFMDKFADISESVDDNWNKIKNWLGDNLSWEGLKGHITDFSKAWTDGFKTISTTVSDKMDEVKKSISDKYTEIKDDVSKKISDISGLASNLWDDGKGGGIKGSLGKISKGFTDTFDAIAKDIKSPLQKVMDAIGGLINGIIGGVNEIINRMNDLSFELNIPDWAKKGLEKAGISLPDSIKFSPNMDHWDFIDIPKLESGGSLNSGQLFVAREAGAELVGNIGGNTAVMNNEQIVRAVSDGVYKAVSQAMAQNNQKEIVINNPIYLDRKELTTQIEQQKQSDGYPLFGAVVYQ